MKRHLKSVGIAVVLGLASVSSAVEPLPGWVATNQLDAAFKQAKEQNRPVAIVYAIRNSSCGLHNRSCRTFMADPSLNGAIKVVLYTDDAPKSFNTYVNAVDGGSGLVPELYLFDPAGNLTGFVDYKEEYLTGQVARTLRQLLRWQEKSAAEIAKADKLARAGRFTAAFEVLDKIQKQDATATAAIARSLGGQGGEAVVDTKPSSSVQSASDAGETERPEETEQQKSEKSKKKAVKIDDGDAKAAPTEAPTEKGRYFADLMDGKRAEYEKLAEERVAAARKLMEEKHYGKARAQLNPMLTQPADLAAVKQATELLDEIAKAERP